MARKTDVFIAGGGPAGLAAAIAARRKGFDVTVADGMRPPIDKACGEGLMPDGLSALGALGIAIPAESSHPFRGIRFAGPGVAVDASFPGGSGLGVRRTTLHRVLVEQAERCGVRLLWGTPLRGIDAGQTLGARWVIGADGGRSRVRQWAGLDAPTRLSHRYAFRRHYRVAPWTRCMEIWWGDGFQIYVTPVTAETVCVALISRDPQLRPDDALPRLPDLWRRLAGAEIVSTDRGAVTSTRRLREVANGRVALIGDASGSVDAITGEGLCLAFRQAVALADAIQDGDLRGYAAEHRRLTRRPAFMADFMLLLDRLPHLRGRALRVLAGNPNIFERLLAMHVGELPVLEFGATAAALGWRMITRS